MSKVNINQYIADLLYQYSSIIVPDLGEFSKQDEAATIDENKNCITPPVNRAVFKDPKEFGDRLKMNDGLLVGYIAKQENITEKEATQAVQSFVADVKEKFAEGQSVNLDGLGTLFKIQGRSIRLIPNEESNFDTETFGFFPVELPGTSAYADTSPSLETSAVPIGAGKSLTTKVENSQEDKGSKKQKKESVSAVLASNVKSSKTSFSTPPPSPKKKTRDIWFWILPLLILGLFVLLIMQLSSSEKSWREHKPFSYFMGSDKGNQAGEKENQGTTTPFTENDPTNTTNTGENTSENGTYIEPKDTETAPATNNNNNTEEATKSNTNTDTPPTTSSEPDNSTENNTTSTSSTANANASLDVSGLRFVTTTTSDYTTTNFPMGYYVIIASYSNERSANKKAKTVPNAHVLPTTKGNYRIGIYLANGAGTAKQQIANIKQKYTKAAWLLQYK